MAGRRFRGGCAGVVYRNDVSVPTGCCILRSIPVVFTTSIVNMRSAAVAPALLTSPAFQQTFSHIHADTRRCRFVSRAQSSRRRRLR